MRLSALALVTLLGGNNVAAFAPAPVSMHQNRHVLNLSDENDNSQPAVSFESAKNAVLGTVTAATLLIGTLAPLPDASLSAANAAVTAAPVATATKTAAKVAPVDPLASEKKAVESAKAAYAAAQKPIADAKAKVALAKSTLNRDKSARESAQKKAVDLKKTLIDYNDRLSQAKSKKKSTKLIELETKNVGKFKRGFVNFMVIILNFERNEHKSHRYHPCIHFSVRSYH